jgi:HAD superfamily hydrolase (TIGR01509 family)
MFNTEDLYDIVMLELCRRRQLVFTDDLRVRMMGRPGERAFEEMIAYHGLEQDDPAEMMVESDAIFSGVLATGLAPMPGLLPLLAALESRGIPKGIATSSRRKYAEYVLNRYELLSRFEFILTAETVQEGKPHPEIYLTAAARHGVAPEAVLVLEDSHNGCRAAIAAGTFAVAVPGKHSLSHVFEGAAFVAESLADPRILAALDG